MLAIRLPARVVYAHACAVLAITTHEPEEHAVAVWSDMREEADALIESVLPLAKLTLSNSWDGGWTTARRKGTIGCGQASASFRYVLITTLDTIAPKEVVLADGPDRRHRTPKGEPTRLGQVAWLCLAINNRTYRKMVFSDLESALLIIDTMSEAVHRQSRLSLRV